MEVDEAAFSISSELFLLPVSSEVRRVLYELSSVFEKNFPKFSECAFWRRPP